MSRVLSVPVLALAALSLAVSASAQQRLRYQDLDLTTDRGVQTLQNRIASTARRECAGEEGTGSRTGGGGRGCERSYREALIRSLPEEVRARLQGEGGGVSARPASAPAAPSAPQQ